MPADEYETLQAQLAGLATRALEEHPGEGSRIFGAIKAARNRGATLLESFPPDAFPDEEQAGLIEECELHIHMLEIADGALPGRVRELEDGLGRILDPDDVSGWRAQPG